MDKSLIIFESTDEIEAFITQRSFDELKSENVHILAIQPDVQAYLKRKNIFFSNTTKFFSKESHQNILLKSAEIIEPFKRLLNIEDGLGIKEGYNNAFLFYIRHYSIVYLLWLTEVVHNAIDQLQPDKIIVVKRKYPLDAMNCIPRNERYLGAIAEKIAVEKGIQIKVLAGKEKHFNSLINKIGISLSAILKIIIFQLNLGLFRYKSKGRKIIMYSSKSYNLEKVVEAYVKKFKNVISVFLISKNVINDFKSTFQGNKYQNILFQLPAYLPKNKRNIFSKELNQAVNRLEQFISNNKQILIYKGVDLQELILFKINRSMIPFLVNLYGQTYNLDKFIKSKKPALVLSQMARGILYNLGELASIYNIPSVIISHGSHVPPSNIYEDIAWGEHGLGLMNTHYKYVAVQSPWALSYLRNKPSSSIPIITGPLLFTKIQKDNILKSSIKKRVIPQHNDKVVILHAGTPKPAQSFRPYVYETVDEYIENINSLIRVVNLFEGVHLIVRFRDSDYLQEKDFLELLIKSDCYSVHSKGSFEDYLAISDLLVSYSSTTIEEALQNRVPVLLYDSQGKYCHIEDAQVLDPSLNLNVDSCYFIGSEEKLEWGLNWVVENHLKKENVSASMWKRHNFGDGEMVNLSSFFGNLFIDQSN